MAVTRVNQSSATPNYFPSTSDNVTIPVPSGYQADDIVVAFVNRGSNNGDIAAPDGSWTRVNTAGSWGFTYSGVDVETDVFWKVMTGSEGTNYAFDAIDATTGGGGCVVLRGADTTTPISVSSVYTLTEGAGNGGSDITVGPATSTADDSYFIGSVNTWDGVGFGSWSGSNVTLTELWDDDSNGYTGAVGGPLASAGSSGTWANSLTYNSDTDYPFFTIMIVVDPAASGVTGTLSVQESGSDTFAGSGSVAIDGSLSAQESGTDAFSGAGTVLVAGSLAAQESGADVFSGAGSVAVSGTLATQESGSDAFAGSGAVAVSGTLAAQESGSDTFAASGVVGAAPITGTMAAQESGSDAFSATGTVADAQIIEVDGKKREKTQAAREKAEDDWRDDLRRILESKYEGDRKTVLPARERKRVAREVAGKTLTLDVPIRDIERQLQRLELELLNAREMERMRREDDDIATLLLVA